MAHSCPVCHHRDFNTAARDAAWDGGLWCCWWITSINHHAFYNLARLSNDSFAFSPLRWWDCWIPVEFLISPRAILLSLPWRAVWSPVRAWLPAATPLRDWRLCQVCPACQRCPAPNPTAPQATVHPGTAWITWHLTNTANTGRAR